MRTPLFSPPVRPHLFVDELASRIGRNKFTVYHWLRESPDKIPPAFRLHGRIVFKVSDVAEWERQTMTPYSPERQSVPMRPAIGRPTKAQQIKNRLEQVCDD